jgi:hypothetical protein
MNSLNMNILMLLLTLLIAIYVTRLRRKGVKYVVMNGGLLGNPFSHTMFCLALFCLVLPYLALSSLVLSCTVLSCLIVTSLFSYFVFVNCFSS